MENILLLVGIVADLQGAWESIVQRFIGPAVIIIVGVIAVAHLAKGEFRPALVDISLGIMVAIVIYAGPSIFGQGSLLVHSGGEIAKQLN